MAKQHFCASTQAALLMSEAKWMMGLSRGDLWRKRWAIVRNLFNLSSSQQGADRLAREWIASIDPQAAVGARHHIVPRFLLARFANNDGRLLVRDRTTGVGSIRSIGDLGVKDFYTSVTIHHTLDSSLETMFSEIEGNAATVIRAHVDAQAFSRLRQMTIEERFILDTFVSYQFVRGMRTRRTMELIADYAMKLTHQSELAPGDVESLSIVPHPNDHLRSISELSEKAHQCLAARPLQIVHLDRPLLLIGDEPVICVGDSTEPTREEIARRHNLPLDDVVHARGSGGGGLANAEQILLPVSPNAVIVYGPVGVRAPASRIRVAKADARMVAKEINDLQLRGAIDWVAAHPGNAAFAARKMPPPVPLMTIADGGSAVSTHTNTNSVRRPINRLRANDIHLQQISDGRPDR